jgi:hypothetical protein
MHVPIWRLPYFYGDSLRAVILDIPHYVSCGSMAILNLLLAALSYYELRSRRN